MDKSKVPVSRYPQTRPAVSKNPTRRKPGWLLLALLASVLVAGIAGYAFLRGSETSSARSACSKAAEDLEQQLDAFEETLGKANKMSQIDAALLANPEAIVQLQEKIRQSPQGLEVLDCSARLPKTQIAEHTSQMLTLAEELRGQQKTLQEALDLVITAQNLKGMESPLKEVDDIIKEAEEALQIAATEKVPTELRSAMSAQLDDAKHLVAQIRSETNLADESVSEALDSLRAAKTQLNQDLDRLRDSIEVRLREKALKEAQAQAEQQRLEEERQALTQQQDRENREDNSGQQGSREDGNTAGEQSNSNQCEVGSRITDAQGRKWLCKASNTGAHWVEQ